MSLVVNLATNLAATLCGNLGHVEPLPPDEAFPGIYELDWDFNDPDMVTASGGNLVSIADKSGNGHTGTPSATIAHFSSGGPNDRGYVRNNNAASSYVSCTGLPITEGSLITQISVASIHTLVGVSALIAGVRSIVLAGLLYSPGDTSWYWQANLSDFESVVASPEPTLGAWMIGQYAMLAAQSRMSITRQNYTGAAHALNSTFSSSSRVEACSRYTSCARHIVLVGEPTPAQIASFTAWALQEYGL